MKRFFSALIICLLILPINGCSLREHETIAYQTDTTEQEEIDQKIIIQRAQEILSNMTLEEKVGQMFIVRCPKTDAAKKAAEYNFGGFILFAKDFENKTRTQVISDIKSYREASKIPMLIGVDEEGGTINRVSKFPQLRPEPFPSSQDLYKKGGWELIKSDTVEKANFLKSLGINFNIAPVCDVSVDQNDFIYKRSFGKNAKLTAEYVKTVVNVMNDNKIGCALKHFPGYGNNEDTHTGIVYDERSFETFEKKDFLPFISGIDANAGAVMISHNIVKCMDPIYPASLSPEVHRILRENLGFNGVIMTDDLYMEAIKQFTTKSEAAVLAVLAGNDLVCCNDFEIQIPAVIQAVNDTTIKQEQIDSSVLKILIWKINLGITN